MQPTVDNDKEAEISRGRMSAIQMLNERVANGQTRKIAAKKIIELVRQSMPCNETKAEDWFDKGVLDQLADLGFKE